uniref:Uncharacterized protein n=1 Tax=Panagrolaimus superbus TaxID=310955 RepID=A0A914Y2X8_9BILA
MQWPPPEFEEQKQQEIETIKNNLPVKAHQRQWPPPPPQYVEMPLNDENAPEEEQGNNIVQQQQQQTSTTKTTSSTTTTTTRRFGSQQQQPAQQEQQQPNQQNSTTKGRFGGQQQQQQAAAPQSPTKQVGGKIAGVQSTGGPVPKPTPQKVGKQPESPAPVSAQTSKLQVTKQQTKTIEKAQETAKIPQPVQPVQQQQKSR